MTLPRRPYGPHDPDPADPLLDGLKTLRCATRDLIVARRTVLRCQKYGSKVVLTKAWRKFYAAEDCFFEEVQGSFKTASEKGGA